MIATTTVPNDAALPLLGTALDETAMAEVFADALRIRGIGVETCRIERIKYRPRRNCTISYLLRLRDAGGAAAYEQRVAARLCHGGDSARRAAQAALRTWDSSAAGPAVLHLDALDMITHWWPNDAKLAAPRLLADAKTLRDDVLPEVVAVVAEARGTLIAHHVELVQYVPEHRLCARVALRWRSRDDAPAGHVRDVYVKAGRETNGASVHAVMRAVETSAAWRSGRLRTPRSLLWQPAHGLHWQEALPGRPLLDVQPRVERGAAAGVGRQLAALHGVAAPIERVCTPADLRRRPHEVAAVLGDVDADWQPALARLAAALDRGAGALTQCRAVTLHGDLHPRNVLLDGLRLSFIDLDSVLRGPAVLDLGAWIADAQYRALLEGTAPARVMPSWQAFLAGYGAGGGEPFDGPLLAWATAYQLLCQRAWRCVVNLKPGRFALTPRLIALAETIVRAGTPNVGASIDAAAASRCATQAH